MHAAQVTPAVADWMSRCVVTGMMPGEGLSDLHLFCFLTPAAGAAEGVDHPVWYWSALDVVLVSNLCPQASGIHCSSGRVFLMFSESENVPQADII